MSGSRVLLEARDLGLDFPMNLYPQHGLRDAFVQFCHNPLEFLTAARDVLPVLRGLSLTIREGDRIGVLGVNGAGKTTLCRILCGMMRPQRGKVQIHGTIEAIFDTANGIMPELTGRENAALLMHLFHSTPVPRAQVEEALEFSELGVFLDAPYKTYSKGMQARLVLSLLSISVSDVLILDEVFDGADVFFREKIAARMRRKIEASGAVVFVSHGPEQVLELCNRVVVLDQGTVAFDGAPEAGIQFYLERSAPRVP